MAQRCPICERNPPDPRYRPFCSKHCADADLGRWLTGRYAIPAVEEDAEERSEKERD
jgi:endogenous inhibitor of DNA gyrase (YacG/DUF329 family)